jgi:hypothetical protein
MAAGVREIKIRFNGDASGLEKASASGEKSVGRFSDRTQKIASRALIGVAAVGAAFGATLKAGVQGLQEGEEAEAKYADALSRSTESMRQGAEAAKAKSEWLQKHTRFTYEDGLAIATAVAKHDSLSKAVERGITDQSELIGMAANLATVMGTDAAGAAEFLGRALAKPEAAAGRLRKAGIALTVAEEEQLKTIAKAEQAQAKLAREGHLLTDAQKKALKQTVALGKGFDSQTFLLDKLAEKTTGAAQAAGETTAGQLERAKNAFGEVQEQLAVGLMPVLTDLLAQLVKVTAWAQDNPGKVKAVVIILGSLAAIVGVVSATIKIWTAVTKTAAAVQAAWNAVLLANPLVLITVAIIALVAAVVLIATKTTWFQQIWQAAWSRIQKAASAVFNWVKSNWPLILAVLTGPIGIAAAAIIKNWDRIKSGAGKMVSGIKGLFAGLADILTAPFRAAVDTLRSVWNNTIGGKGVPSIGIGPFKTPGFTIPYLARGGTARAGMPHIVGERGPELFIPGRTGTVIPNHALGGDVVVELHGNGDALEAVVERVVVRRDRTTRNAVLAGSRRAIA